MVTFWTVSTDRLIPRCKVTVWITITTVENTISLGFSFNNMAFLALRASHTDFLNNSLSMTTIWEIAAGVKLAKSPQLDDHRTSTNLAVETSWLILDLNFFHFRLSFGYFLFERSVKLINNLLPLLFSDFYIVQFCFHLSGKLHIHDTREKFNNQRINDFTKFCWLKTLGNQLNIIAFLNGLNGRCVSRRSANSIFFESLDKSGFRIASRWLSKVLLWIGIDTFDSITFFHIWKHFIFIRVIINS